MAKEIAKKSAYVEAGVNIDEMMSGLERIKAAVHSTKTPGVCGGIGAFGGAFQSPGKECLLVASTDGVGTKLKVAQWAARHDTIGQCLVNHCVNDILTQGARPLFFLDYLGTAKLKASVFAEVVKGLCVACRENGCALLGGETAEMPGLYPEGEYDLVGTIVGVVDKKKMVTGKTLKRGDVLIGLPSSGLQTNGYSLARKVLFTTLRMTLSDMLPGTRCTVGEVLLAVHASFLKPVTALQKAGITLHGMAHITGGGLIDNPPRMLPKGLDVVIRKGSWTVPPIFTFLQEKGKIDPAEMYRVFNMGIGYIVAVRPADVSRTLATLKKCGVAGIDMGTVETGTGVTRLI